MLKNHCISELKGVVTAGTWPEQAVHHLSVSTNCQEKGRADSAAEDHWKMHMAYVNLLLEK